jgi:predicted XRE-type DNA-binding protein
MTAASWALPFLTIFHRFHRKQCGDSVLTYSDGLACYERLTIRLHMGARQALEHSQKLWQRKESLVLAQPEDTTDPPTADPSRPGRSRRRADRPLSRLPATSPLPTLLWHEPSMAAALAERDMATVYRLLQEQGLSQRSIAARTGQSQSEISEVMSGRRIVSYDVLARIADGLGIPRGYLGMAYCAPGTHPRPESTVDNS